MDPLRSVADKLAAVVRKWDDILVVGHYDADGITSTAILVSALSGMDKNVEFLNLKQLYSDDIERINDAAEHVIFADMGVGQLPYLLERMERPFIVLDHHRIPPGVNYPFLLHPDLANLNGATEISGAGVSYVFARSLGAPKELAALAVVGAVGDLQARGGGLKGYNRTILSDAIAANAIFAYRDILLYGRNSRPLPYMLLFSTDPILPGLTANEQAVFDFLKSAGIDYVKDGQWLSYVDLSPEDRRRFFTALSLYLSRRGWPEDRILSLVGEVYDFVSEDLHSPLREVREYATLLNACGRHGHPEIGVHVAMGDRGKWFQRAKSLLREHREAIRRGIEWLYEQGVYERRYLSYFHARDVIPASIVGIVAGMVYGSGIVPVSKVILGMAYDGSYVKASARATAYLVRKGVDLAHAMRTAAEHVGGEAGGHKPAAGARIPRGSEEEFVEQLDRIIGEQIT